MKKNNIAFIIFAVVAVVLVALCGVFGATLASSSFIPETEPENALNEFSGVIDSNAVQSEAYYEEIANMKDLQEIVSAWASVNNDAKMHTSSVTTYLLVVKEAGTVATNYGNADMIALVSVNSEAKEVSSISLDKDSLVYINLTNSNVGVNGPAYAKMSTAYANGGIALLQDTIENNFKIEIDHYLVTDMNGVKAVVDELGGIQLAVAQEVKTMVSEDFAVTLPADNTALNGTQAVALLREKRDGASARLNRQADVLRSVITAAKELGSGDAMGLLKVLAGTAKSDLSGGSLLSAVRQTLLGGWDDYSVSVFTSPEEENSVQYKDSEWIRIIDTPVVAQSVQEKLFNKTNINLNANRISSVELIKAVNKLYNDELAKLNPDQESTTQKPQDGELSGADENEETTEKDDNEDVGTVG